MKPAKVLALTALAALAAIALVAVPAAAAETTTLCLTDEAACEEPITHVHEESVGKAVLLSSVKVECNVLFLGDALNEGTGSPLVIHGSFTYTECGGCTVKEENGPAEIKVLKESHETGSVTGEGLVKVVCTGFISCAYNGVGLKGTARGPLLASQKNGEVSLQSQTTNKEAGGFLCPTNSKLDITTTPLEVTHIASESQPISIQSCMKKEVECQVASTGTTFEIESSSFRLEGSGEEPAVDECETLAKGEIKDPITEKAGDQIEIAVISVKFSNCTGEALEAKSLPWVATTDHASYEIIGGFEWGTYLITTFGGLCKYSLSPPEHTVLLFWDFPLTWLDKGLLKLEPGSLEICDKLKTVDSTLGLFNIKDPGLKEVSALVIN